MPQERKVNVELDREHAEKLSRAAERAQAPPEALAATLLSFAIDDLEFDPQRMTEILDGIPGAFERVQNAERQAAAGKTVHVSDL